MNKLALLFIAMVFIYSNSANNYVHKSQKGISLSFSKSSPPIAIFDDEKLNPTFIPQVHPLITAASVLLKSGARDYSEKILFNEESNEQSVRVINLGGMTLSKEPVTVHSEPEKKEQPQNLLPSETYVPNPNKSPQAQFEDIKMHFVKQEFISGLSPVQKAIVERVNNFEQILAADYSQPSFQEQAARIIEKETFAETEPAKPSEESGALASDPAPAPAESTEPIIVAGNSRSLSENITDEKPGIEDSQVVISGNIEMQDGLAYVGQDQTLKVYRKVGGEFLEEGNVLLNDGKYEIFVRNPKEGVLVAELKTIDQQVLGRGEVLLKEILNKARDRQDLKNVMIRVSPTTTTAKIVVTAGDSLGGNEKIESAQFSIGDFSDTGLTDKKGAASVEILTNSNMILKANKPGYWGSLFFQTAKEKSPFTLFGDETVQAWFQQLNINPAGIKKNGIILGEVKIKGAPVSDVTVELVSSEAAIQPTYFVGSIIPDKTLLATTKSGRFAFFEVEPGIYLVRAKYRGKYFSPQVVVVDRGYISNVSIQWQGRSSSEIYVYDIETGKPINSELKFIGSDQTASSPSGIHNVNFAGSEGPQIIEARASHNHFVSRATIDKSEKQFLIPIVSYDWVQKILARARVNQDLEKSIIVGFAKKPGMRVEMDPLGYNPQTEVVYFDASGDPLLGSHSAPLGGGVVIINNNPGLRTLLLSYEGTKQPQFQTILSEPEIIGIFNPNY